jgi:hypothetical protein
MGELTKAGSGASRRRSWRKAAAAGAALIVVVTPLTFTAPAGAGHVNRGEGHGASGPTIDLRHVEDVNFDGGDCEFRFTYVPDGLKGNPRSTYPVVATSDHGIGGTVSTHVTKANNGILHTSLSVFSHAADGDTVTFTLQLTNEAGDILATSEPSGVTVAC